MLFPREHSFTASAQWRSDRAQSNPSPEDCSLIQTHHHFVSHCAGEICMVRQPGISCCVVPHFSPSSTASISPLSKYILSVFLYSLIYLVDVSYLISICPDSVYSSKTLSDSAEHFPAKSLTKYWLWNRKGQLSNRVWLTSLKVFFSFFSFLWNYKGFQLNKYELINVHLPLHRRGKNGLPHLICELFHFR